MERRRGRAEQGDGARLRGELVEAARELLVTEARLDALTLRRVAREVGVSTPSIYLHFDTREQLVDAAVAAQFDRLRQATLDAAASVRSPRRRLRAVLSAYAEFAESEPGAFAVIFTSIPLDGVRTKASSIAALDVLVDAVGACLEHVDPAPAEQMARRAWAYLHGVVLLRIAMPDFGWPSMPETIDQLIRDVGIAHSEPHQATGNRHAP